MVRESADPFAKISTDAIEDTTTVSLFSSEIASSSTVGCSAFIGSEETSVSSTVDETSTSFEVSSAKTI